MTSVAEIAKVPVAVVKSPEIVEPDEFDPIYLFWLTKQVFKWNMADFAAVFGWELETIRKWTYGQKPSRQARIRAATLKKIWEI